jgi:hypothetical protein
VNQYKPVYNEENVFWSSEKIFGWDLLIINDTIMYLVTSKLITAFWWQDLTHHFLFSDSTNFGSPLNSGFQAQTVPTARANTAFPQVSTKRLLKVVLARHFTSIMLFPILQLYAGCDSAKTCFGSPANCFKTGDCDYMVSWTYAGNNKVKRPARVSFGFLSQCFH